MFFRSSCTARIQLSARNVAQLVERLPIMHEALGSVLQHYTKWAWW